MDITGLLTSVELQAEIPGTRTIYTVPIGKTAVFSFLINLTITPFIVPVSLMVGNIVIATYSSGVLGMATSDTKLMDGPWPNGKLNRIAYYLDEGQSVRLIYNDTVTGGYIALIGAELDKYG